MIILFTVTIIQSTLRLIFYGSYSENIAYIVFDLRVLTGVRSAGL
jgi:hypothetical protein